MKLILTVLASCLLFTFSLVQEPFCKSIVNQENSMWLEKVMKINKNYSIVLNTFVTTRKFFFLLLFGLLTLSGCKEDCVGCNVECKSFNGVVPVYCLSDFNNDRVAYEAFIDSLEQLYPSKDLINRVGFCEDEARAVQLESEGWQCNRYKD